MDTRQEWVAAELAWVSYLLAFVLQDEAQASPLLAPWVGQVLAKPGKMLRPRLVVAGARLAAGERLDFQQFPVPDPRFDHRPLDALREGFRSRIGPGNLPMEPLKEFQEWKGASPFPGGLPNRVYLLGVAVEMLHLASLAHDDVVDGSDLRRGQASAPALLGNSNAILLGDLMFTLCFSLANEGASGPVAQSLSAMVRLMVRSELDQAAGRQQFERILAGDHPPPGRRQYLRTIGGKTALLFAMALATGAAEMGADRQLLRQLEAFGFTMGLAFQMADDLLDLQGGAEAMGKRPGQDLQDGQLTLPVLLGLEADREGHLARAIGEWRQGHGSVQAILRCLDDLGALAGCRREIQLQRTRARRHLEALGRLGLSRPGLEDLGNLLDFVVERRN